ncbi:tyrosine-type recombinase/integrase [Pelagicoccus mobilis]|uniref:Core-binding (CB) domain-containing protein n=1 Tax=Pelagicoccus mobilis TaxID=415221 RepID=A0A934RWT5_9BACT|nr:hypothetical protein [Pelagicoccus mobilis]MBK1877961.1 hypothetical protein [Pelagicoccus mobilis]
MNTPVKLSVAKFKNPSGKLSWRVSGTVNGVRVRKNFKTRPLAEGYKQEEELDSIKNETFRAAITTLTDRQLSDAQAAYARLGATHSILKAVDYYLKHYRAPVSYNLVSDVLDEFYDWKRSTGVRERSIKQLRSSLSRFADVTKDLLIHEIKLQHLQDYIDRQSWKPKTQNNFRADIHSFFEWCKAKPREWIKDNPASDLPKFKIERGIPHILDFKQSKDLMHYVAWKDAEMVPYFALALFAGIRPQYPTGELGKIAQMGAEAWDLIDFRNKVIRIPPNISKTGEYRTINIQPNLAEWLKPFAKEKASIAVTNFERRLKRIRAEKKLGHDVLRHTFISMHVAKFKSVGNTALQSGNSEAIVRRHYLKMVAENESKRFWAIKQPTQEEVGALKEEEARKEAAAKV